MPVPDSIKTLFSALLVPPALLYGAGMRLARRLATPCDPGLPCVGVGGMRPGLSGTVLVTSWILGWAGHHGLGTAVIASPRRGGRAPQTFRATPGADPGVTAPQALALAMDVFGNAVAELASISERRQARLVDTSLSGLPPFLVENSGLNSGFMIAQYTSAALVSENKVLAHPSSVDSIPTSANQEDHVSMGAYSARKGLSILDNARKVVAIELLAGSQALDFSRLLKPGAGTTAAHDCVRGAVPYLKHDEFLQPLIERVEALVSRGAVVKAVEEAIGPLD